MTTATLRKHKKNKGITGTMYGSGFNHRSSVAGDDDRLVLVDGSHDSTNDVIYQWNAIGRGDACDDGTLFLQGDQQTIAVYTSGAATNRPTHAYVFASYINEPVISDNTSGLRYYHRGQQSSVTALTDSSGTD